MIKPELVGSFVALATPFRGGALDEAAYRALCESLLAQGTDGLVPCGTTGETPTLDEAEQRRCVAIAVEVGHKAGKPVIAGAGSNSTAQTARNVAAVRDAGADGALVVTPYYNKPTQAGIVEHYRAVAKAVPGFPIVAYVVPGRTGVDLLPDTYVALAEVEEVVAVKEATASLQRVIDIREKVGDRFTLLSGDDFTVLPFIAAGGKGVISVSANVAPRHMADLVHKALAGDLAEAGRIQVAMNALHRALFVESNPIPVKAALHMQGLFADEVRLPLLPAAAGTRKLLEDSLRSLGVLAS
ncbi:4-hydroxy-tetrahydrodipicolinate synthase [Vulgatibacter incomptus]|uniref:4-hydroxy-tetrahydrodipicolinate synthase n=1 Tax=Vulgatibacter incomptus TaxID=1391653 RepID=A0A0K1PE53_9BACT|nr:4-hydroxy-tetrahydrodipicolinate synthase [Vulgatibacter incomptus]AKU91772.1 4-hydroxy-tetrahydrodipicolinate synthase [Vulgatibacter incomptus]